MHPAKNRPILFRLRCAATGFIQALCSEHSLRFQAAACLAVWVVLLVFRPNPIWWALMLSASALVMGAELFNTAIERLADHLHPELHPEIRIVKDCAAGAVLCSVIAALSIGVAFGVHLLRR